jgi:hypothetical protein
LILDAGVPPTETPNDRETPHRPHRAENIKLMQEPRPPQGVVEGFLALGDATGIVSDVIDAEEKRCKAIEEGIPVPDISRASYGEKG